MEHVEVVVSVLGLTGEPLRLERVNACSRGRFHLSGLITRNGQAWFLFSENDSLDRTPNNPHISAVVLGWLAVSRGRHGS